MHNVPWQWIRAGFCLLAFTITSGCDVAVRYAPKFGGSKLEEVSAVADVLQAGPRGDDILVTIAAKCPSVVTRVDATTVWLCGRLEDGVAEQLSRLLQPPDTTLIITSGGGLPLYAVEVANIVREKNLRLVVRGICTSACAHFLFMTIDDVLVDQGALVGFHRSNSFVARISSNLGEIPTPMASAGANAEQLLYDKAGLDRRFLFLPGLQVQPLCVTRGGGDDNSNLIASRYRFSVPSRQTINRFRHKPFNGFWYGDANDRPSTFRFGSAQFRVTYSEDRFDLNNEEMEANLKRVPFC